MESGKAEPEVGKASAPLRVAICVATHQRPEGLARLLAALDAQRLPEPAPELRVVVVDNDAAETARSVCRHAASWLGMPLTYATEKRRGIPQARNAALALVLGQTDFIAFVDDDCEPAPDWLAALLRTQAARGADAVAGPCLPSFEVAPPPWIEEGGFFAPPRPGGGEELVTAYTHNLLVRAEALAALEALFDERLALGGGSDNELFRRFVRAGHRIVWTDEARVTEHVPDSRATLAWLLRRSFRIGTSSAFIERLHAGARPVAPHLLAHGAWCVAKGAGLLALAGFRGRAAAASALRLVVFGAGRIAGIFGVLTREYAVTHGH